MNSNFEKAFHQYIELVDVNPLMYNINQTFNIKTKSRYSFEDPGTDRRTDRQTYGIDSGMYSQRHFKMIYDASIKTEN